MSRLSVTVDTSEAEAMFDEILDDLAEVPDNVADAAEEFVDRVEITAVDTGNLAASVYAEGDQIVTDVDYAHYPFFGTKYIAEQPPILHFDDEDLADYIEDELFGKEAG